VSGNKPKDPTNHYAVFLRAGVGQQLCILSMDSDLSACMAALFLALQYFPKVHQVEVYRKGSKDPAKLDDIGEGIAIVPMSNMLKFYAPSMEQLTGIQAPTLTIPIEGKEMGEKEVPTRVSAAKRRR
jgi:hypothetical protein